MENSLEKWSDYFKLVGNPVRFAVVLLLYASEILRGKHSLRFTEIAQILDIPSGSTSILTHYLNQLIEGGFLIKDNKERRNPLYHISNEGRQFLEDLGLTKILKTKIEDLSKKSI